MSWSTQSIPCDHTKCEGAALKFPFATDEPPRLVGFFDHDELGPHFVVEVHLRSASFVDAKTVVQVKSDHVVEVTWTRGDEARPPPNYRYVGTYVRQREPGRDPDVFGFDAWHVYAWGLDA